MAVGAAGTFNDTNVRPHNDGDVLPKQVDDFQEAVRSTPPNDASGTQPSKGEHAAEHSQETSKAFALILATRPPINFGNQIGRQGVRGTSRKRPGILRGQRVPAERKKPGRAGKAWHPISRTLGTSELASRMVKDL